MFVLPMLFFLGILTGYILGSTVHATKPSGNLLIETTDPDGPFMFLEVHESVEEILKKDRVSLCVKLDKITTQK